MINGGYWLILISFLLDGFVSLYQPFALFSVVVLELSYPFLFKRNKTYLKSAFGLGLCYDLVYTNTLFLNAILFLLLGVLIKRFYRYFNYNFINGLLLLVLVVSCYEVTVYIVLCLVQYFTFSIKELSLALFYFLVVNLIYYL